MKGNPLKALYLLGLLIIIIPLSALAQEERKVAVFDPEGSVNKALLEIVREEISSVVVNTAGYTVLERQLINKVLEENKFQESGLVNEEQVSDIGKRMGADYVFVTSISTFGDNYYISCKMIEVATARIDKQSTGSTSDGENDIPQTTQYIVNRLFGESARQQEQADAPIQMNENQIDEAQVENPADNNLIQKDVVTDKKNEPYKVELNKKTSSSKTPKILIATGSILIPAGLAATFFLRKEYVEYKDATRIIGKEYNLFYAGAGIVAGSVCIGVGNAQKKKERERVDLVVSENGVGLRLTF